MFNLENAIQNWKQSLKKSPAFEEGQIKEMETHLRDHIEHLIAKGLPEKKAFNRAAEKFGATEELEDEIYKTKTTKVNATPPWKQQTWVPSLLPNFLKVSLRSIKRDIAYSGINIAGLAIGLACALIITLWIVDELSYDDHHLDSERIVRLVTNLERSSGDIYQTAFSSPQWGEMLKDRYPEVDHFARLMKYRSDILVQESQDEAYYESRFVWADPEIFETLTIPFISGDPETALNQPNSLVISESTAQKYFGDNNPIGRQLQVDWGGIRNFTVTGVMEDFPESSHLETDFLGTFLTIEETWAEAIENGALYFYTYLKLTDERAVSELEIKLPDFLLSAEGEEFANQASLELQTIEQIHLYSQREDELKPTGNILFIYAMGTIVFLVMCVAMVNYVNLTTARSTLRFKEVGVRKVLGGSRSGLIAQFFTETLVQIVIAVLLSFLLAGAFLPFINEVLSKSLGILDIPVSLWVGLTLALIVLLSLLSGVYPALKASMIDPVRIFRSAQPNLASGSGFRKGMVAFQFVITSLLIVATITVFLQNQYISSRNLGYDKENIVVIPLRSEEVLERKQQIRNFFQDAGVAQESSLSSHQMGGQVYRSTYAFQTTTGEVEEVMNRMHVDNGFLETYGLELLAGRFFERGFSGDTSRFVINNSATQQLGVTPDEAIGMQVSYIANGSDGPFQKTGSVMGVVKDFNQQSLHHTVEPLVMDIVPARFQFLSLRLPKGNVQSSLEKIQSDWNEITSSAPFNFWFLDNSLNELYQAEKQIGKLLGFFAFIAVCLGCIGLFALTAYATAQRTKEIGLRRVLGASVSEIVGLLMKNYLVLAMAGFLAAIPLSWYSMNVWLQRFAYRIELDWYIYLISFVIVAILAAAAMSIQTVKAALANPVKSLRSE